MFTYCNCFILVDIEQVYQFYHDDGTCYFINNGGDLVAGNEMNYYQYITL